MRDWWGCEDTVVVTAMACIFTVTWYHGIMHIDTRLCLTYDG